MRAPAHWGDVYPKRIPPSSLTTRGARAILRAPKGRSGGRGGEGPNRQRSGERRRSSPFLAAGDTGEADDGRGAPARFMPLLVRSPVTK